MKPHQRVLDVQSTVQVSEDRRVKMSIEEGAMAHIMGILTDLYSDPEAAVLREYATNAADAHVEAKVNLPIEVTLPTTLSPYLRIRDYGNGLDIDDIRSIYSRYGASTKRETNDQVGSLGLGCKSALTYTDQFTLQGIKDGIATQVAISRDEDGAGSMTIVAEYETDEASGVEITVPAKGYNDFEEKAEYLFQFWPEGSVLVNGEEPKRIEGIELEPGLFVVPVADLSESVVVMGNVPYPLRNDDQSYFSVIAYVEMGAVQFTPSREELQMTTRTKNVLADIGTKVANLKKDAAQRMVDEATSKPEALASALHASRLFRFDGELTYKGKAIPTEVAIEKDETSFLVYGQNKRYYRDRSVSSETRIPASIFPTTLFFTGFANKGLNPTQRERIAYYLRENNIDTQGVNQYVLLDELRYSSWVEKGRIVKWENVKAVKLPKQTTESGRPVGAYDVITPGNKYSEPIEAVDMEDAKHIFWYAYQDRLESRLRDLLQTERPDCFIVTLKENRVSKFERMFPQAKRVSDAAREIGQAWFNGLTEGERKFLSVRKMSDHDSYSLLDPAQIADPKIKLIVEQARKTNKALLEKSRRFACLYDGEIGSVDTEDYPLLNLSEIRWMEDETKASYLKHVYLYLNAVYALSLSLTDGGDSAADSTNPKENS